MVSSWLGALVSGLVTGEAGLGLSMGGEDLRAPRTELPVVNHSPAWALSSPCTSQCCPVLSDTSPWTGRARRVL